MVITSVDRGIGTATIAGNGFCDYVNATDSGTGVTMTYTKVVGKGVLARTLTLTRPSPVLSWADNEIVVECTFYDCTLEVDSVPVPNMDIANISIAGPDFQALKVACDAQGCCWLQRMETHMVETLPARLRMTP